MHSPFDKMENPFDRHKRLFLSSLPQFGIVALRALCLIAAPPACIAHWARRPPPPGRKRRKESIFALAGQALLRKNAPRTAHVVRSRAHTARATPTRTAHDMLQITLGGVVRTRKTGQWPVFTEQRAGRPRNCGPSKPPTVFRFPDILCCTIFMKTDIVVKERGCCR